MAGHLPHKEGDRAPSPLSSNFDIISTIAYVTFYGRDQAGNDVSATASIGVDFANFAD